MAVSFKEIEKKFEETFGFIESDLKRILALEVGGNYAVALLVACACDTLAESRYGKGQGEKVFRKLLPDGPYRKAAKPIYDALRNGFAHRYNGYDIPFDGQTLRIAIAWKKGKHLGIETRREAHPSQRRLDCRARQHALPVLSNDAHFDRVAGITRIAF